MEKPIIATTFSGLFVKHEPWDKAHVLWYKKAAEQLNDSSIMQWANRPDYFKGVDDVMKRLYPDRGEEERTRKARELFFESVLQCIKDNPSVRNEEIIKYFKALKKNHRLALITTNEQSALERMLDLTGLKGLFDIIESSKAEEKDDKIVVFERFISKYGLPLIYIGGSRKDSFDYCKIKGIKAVFANFEAEEELLGVESAHNLVELREKIKG